VPPGACSGHPTAAGALQCRRRVLTPLITNPAAELTELEFTAQGAIDQDSYTKISNDIANQLFAGPQSSLGAGSVVGLDDEYGQIGAHPGDGGIRRKTAAHGVQLERAWSDIGSTLLGKRDTGSSECTVDNCISKV
jgi:hypothetical protein